MQRRHSGLTPGSSRCFDENRVSTVHPTAKDAELRFDKAVVDQAVFPVGGIVLAYYYAVTYDQVRYPYLYISTVIQWDPSRIYGGFGMTMAAVLFGFFAYARMAFVEYRIEANDVWTHRCQTITKFSTFTTILGMVGVACIPFYRMPVTHLVFAGTFFVSAMVVAICATYVDYKVSGGWTKMIRLRALLVCCALLFSVILGLVVLFWPFVGSVMEVLAVLACFLFVATYAVDMGDYDLVVSVRRRSNAECGFSAVDLDGFD